MWVVLVVVDGQRARVLMCTRLAGLLLIPRRRHRRVVATHPERRSAVRNEILSVLDEDGAVRGEPLERRRGCVPQRSRRCEGILRRRRWRRCGGGGDDDLLDRRWRRRRRCDINDLRLIHRRRRWRRRWRWRRGGVRPRERVLLDRRRRRRRRRRRQRRRGGVRALLNARSDATAGVVVVEPSVPPAAAKGGASARRTRTGTHAARDTRGMTPLGVRRVRRGGCSACARRTTEDKFTRLGLGASEKEVQESQKSRFVYALPCI